MARPWYGHPNTSHIVTGMGGRAYAVIDIEVFGVASVSISLFLTRYKTKQGAPLPGSLCLNLCSTEIDWMKGGI